MPFDIAPFVEPETTVLLVSECQEAILGEESALAGLASAARAVGLVETIGEVLDAAREQGVKIVHALVERRSDGYGDALNTPLSRKMVELGGAGQGMASGSTGARPIAGLEPLPEDIVLARTHGITAFYETGLDSLLRSAGTRNIIMTGVSLNVAVFGATLEAVNRGYRVVIPCDCVVADPPQYTEQLLHHSLRSMAWITDSQAIRSAWGKLE